uniref:TBC1 domain family member 22B-like isoform X2 n=1 Tax=Myxine glutinosa TaxID=7769 RepID=UPI00358F6526
MAADGGRRQFWRRGAARLPGSIQVGAPAAGGTNGGRGQREGGLMGSGFGAGVGAIVTGDRGSAGSGSNRPRKATSFQEFAKDTSDAWDLDVSEDELLALATRSLASDVVMATANEVLQKHRGGSGSSGRGKTDKYSEARASSFAYLEQEEDADCKLPSGDWRLVKSRSEAQIGSGSKCASLPRQQSLTLPSVNPPAPMPHRHLLPLVARFADQNTSGAPSWGRDAARLSRFHDLLTSPNMDLDELRKCSWSGIPKAVRPITWRLLSGYLPANMERREPTLHHKRQEYFAFVDQYYGSRNDDHHQDTYRQIHIDIPRTNPLIPLFQQPAVQEIFERILFIWAIRHPASGYVQGINDLVTPFFVVFLSEHAEEDVESYDVSLLPAEVNRGIEADSYWCMSKLLDGIQDNYTFAQPGVQRKVNALGELVSRIDEAVHSHIERHEVEYLQFAFRWMNNLLMRELPLRCTIRLWDTYQAEPEGFSQFHLYVCAAFLTHWRKEILSEKDFQGLMLLLQNLPTMHWGNEEVSLLLAEAYRLKFMFADAPNHYRR